MSKNFLIDRISVSTSEEFTELAGYVDGERIYFRAPKQFALYPRAEWFVGIALLEAMFSNRTIEVDSSIAVSQQLHDNLTEIQGVFSCWNNDLSIVKIDANTDIEPANAQESNQKNVGVYFSAGIDSSHALLCHLAEVTHLIMFRVFDNGNDQESWTKRVHKQTLFADSIGKSLIPIETNARQWSEEKQISWEFFHGPFLASAGTALGMSKIYVPSSHTYGELFPWGSHPLVDPMWSTENTKVIHDGARYRRGVKTRQLLEQPVLADNLQVCWRSTHSNCGECPKCIRSMTAIYLLGGATKSLPRLIDLKMLHHLKANDESGATFLEDAMILAKDSKNESIYRTLRGYYRRYQVSQLWPLLDRNLLGGLLRRTYRKVRKPDWLNWRVTLRGSNRWDI